ncbi:capsular polysaccharide biosynthesis protein [Spirosoma knui]
MDIWQTIRQAITPQSRLHSSPGADACFWRVDMHSHLVPGIDDGVGSPEEAIECLKQLAAWGIQKVISTPHVSYDWYPNDSATLRAGQVQLQTLADEHHLDLKIEVAAEYLLDELLHERIQQNDVLTFGTARYVLFELGWAAAPMHLLHSVAQLKAKGYTPVLAHPERYPYYWEDLSALSNLREQGCLFQLNWGSLTGLYSGRVQTQARSLLTHGWVDFISSDLHRPRDLKALSALFTMPEYEQLRNLPLRNESLCEPLTPA